MRIALGVVVTLCFVAGTSSARPPRLAKGEQPRLEHVVDGAPAWARACPITLVQDTPETLAVGASCGAFETMMFERKRLSADEFEARVHDEAQEAGAPLVAVTIPTALGPATGYAFVLEDRRGPNTYVMVRRPGAKNAPSDLLTCTSGATSGDQLARCKAALESLGKSSLVRSGKAGFPRAAGDRAGS
jgi:hypothetical protein